MKYGQVFQAQSVPQWAPYNVDYNELKNLIKANTTRDQGQGQAIAIPGQTDTSLQRFEEQFFNELSNQHDRVDLFVKSKADEISRRLQFLQKSVLRLLARCTYDDGKPVSRKRRDRFSRYDTQISRCGEDAQQLQRFVEAQRMAFHKILKKYRKWTGSRSLGDRFNDEILGSAKSFTKRDFQPLLAQQNDLLTTLRAATPLASEVSSPSRLSSRRASRQIEAQPVQQAYWNEYDDGSEADNEPYTIDVSPGEESTFPGAATITYVLEKAKAPVQIVKRWLVPGSLPAERAPLIGHENGGYYTDTQATDTEAEDEAYASSSDFPSGYATHYATFPSVKEQKLQKHRDHLLFQATIGSLGAAIVLLVIASILVATGKHRLRIEVDAGVIVGVVSSLFFAALGFGTMLYRTEDPGWLHRIAVGVIFVTICVLNGMLLVLVAGSTGG